ncbi:MAG: MobC family plasmid mobilization relaxosome protein [Firmicutes bacterium]|nr:MobC family plasmid mobilization relaxosome protein [Bacillota bacterium]
MQKRKRNNQVKFYVNDEELKLINDRVRSANVTNRGAYLRKMAIDGYIVNVDTSDLKAVIKEMNAVGKNINQITRNANIYGIDQQDIDTLKAKVDEIWQLLKSILSNTLSANQ